MDSIKRSMAATINDSVSFPIPCDGFPNLVFDLAGPSDVKELSDFIMEEFFHRFPLKNVLDVEKEVRPWIGQYIGHLCTKKFSILLRDITNENRIVAAAINDLDYKDRKEEDISLISFADPIERPGWQKICGLLAELELDLDTDPVLSIDLMTVSQAYSKRGLSSLCAKHTVQLAKSKGIRVIKVEAVSEFISLGFAKLGFELVKEIDYNELEIDGEKPFVTTSIHQKARAFIFNCN